MHFCIPALVHSGSAFDRELHTSEAQPVPVPERGLGDARVVHEHAVRARQILDAQRVVSGGQPAMKALDQRAIENEVGSGRPSDRLDGPGAETERQRISILRGLQDPRRHFTTSACSQPETAETTSGVMCLSLSAPYSSTSPVVAGMSR